MQGIEQFNIKILDIVVSKISSKIQKTVLAEEEEEEYLRESQDKDLHPNPLPRGRHNSFKCTKKMIYKYISKGNNAEIFFTIETR